MGLLRELADDGILVIGVMHDINLAAQFSHEMMLMDDGKIVSRGTPDAVLTSENIERAFQISTEIKVHPRTGIKYVLPPEMKK